jgi:hypothetical protein
MAGHLNWFEFENGRFSIRRIGSGRRSQLWLAAAAPLAGNLNLNQELCRKWPTWYPENRIRQEVSTIPVLPPSGRFSKLQECCRSEAPSVSISRTTTILPSLKVTFPSFLLFKSKYIISATGTKLLYSMIIYLSHYYTTFLDIKVKIYSFSTDIVFTAFLI